MVMGVKNQNLIIWPSPIRLCREGCRVFRYANTLCQGGLCDCPFWLFDRNSWTLYAITFEVKTGKLFLRCSVWEFASKEEEEEKEKEKEEKQKWRNKKKWTSFLGEGWMDGWRPFQCLLEARGGYLFFGPWERDNISLQILEGKTGKKVNEDPWQVQKFGLVLCSKVDVFYWKTVPFFVLSGHGKLCIVSHKGRVLYLGSIGMISKEEQFDFVSDHVFWRKIDKDFISWMSVEFWLTQKLKLNLSLFQET